MNATLINTTPIGTMLFFGGMLFFCLWMFTHNVIDSLLISALVGLILYLFPLYACAAISIGMAGFVLYASLSQFKGSSSTGPEKPTRETLYTKDGRIIAYRYVIKDASGYMSITQAGLSRNGGKWEDGYLESDRVPTTQNNSGIYAARSPHSPILDDYRNKGYTMVKVELSGRVVEGEDGFRAQCCQVLEEL